MNRGYMNHTTMQEENVNCPICGSDIYMNKYGNDFRCLNEKCALNMNVGNLMVLISGFFEEYNKGRF